MAAQGCGSQLPKSVCSVSPCLPLQLQSASRVFHECLCGGQEEMEKIPWRYEKVTLIITTQRFGHCVFSSSFSHASELVTHACEFSLIFSAMKRKALS